MHKFLYITTKKQLVAILELSNNILSIVMPMREGSIREKTNRALQATDFGFHDVFMDLPVLWMDSILDRLEDIDIGMPIKISSKEVGVLIELVNFLNENEIFVGDVEGVNRILSEISNTDNKDFII